MKPVRTCEPPRASSLLGELRASWRMLAGVLVVLLATIGVSTAYLLMSVSPRLTAAIETSKGLRCIQTAMLDQETVLRAYVSTGEPTFARQAADAATRTAQCKPRLVEAAAGDPEQSQRVVRLLVEAGTWQRDWASRALQSVPGEPRADLSTFFTSGSILFNVYRAVLDDALAHAGSHREQTLDLQRTIFEATGLAIVVLVLSVLGVELRRRRRLQRVVEQPVRDLLTAMRRIDGGELGVHPPVSPVEEFRELGAGLSSLARRLEREQAQSMLREETATRLAARLEIVLRVARRAAGSPSPNAVAEMVAAAAVELGRVRAMVWLEGEGSELVAVHAGGAGVSPPQSPAVTRAAQQARPVRDGDRACFPLVSGGRVVGVLDVIDEAWDDEDAAQVDSVLEALARFAAVALESARLHQQTIEQARSDALTGLRNRRSLDTDLPVEWQRARRYDRPFSVALLDLDHFKRVNDTAGHAVGDEWLRLVGGVVLGRLRTSDSAYRYGGEELVVLLPETDADAAFIVADRLREAVAATPGPAGYPAITVSIGLATATHAMATPQDLMDAADIALYAAKAAGRDQVVAAATDAKAASR